MVEPRIIQTSIPPGFIDLGLGNPDTNLLPMDLIRRSAEKYFTEGDQRTLQYGAEQGNERFRKALSEFLTQAYRTEVDPDLLFVTTGSSSGLDLICTLYTKPGDIIFVEEPTYFLALRIYADHGLKVIPIPMDEDGMIVEALEEKLGEYDPKFVYTIPTFQNPSGRTLSQERRRKLVELAHRYNFLIVADEVYHLLPYTQNPPQPFAVFSEEVDQVVSVNSFSKILAPGLRLGWIQAHETVIHRLGRAGLLDSGGGLNPFTSTLVRDLIKSGGLAENIENLKFEYTSRLNVLESALLEYFPKAEYETPQGGFFFWVRLPGVDMVKLRAISKTKDVDIRQGALFSSQSELQDYMRLCFSYYGKEEIIEGIQRLSEGVSLLE